MPNLGFVDQVADQVAANPGTGMQPPPPPPGPPGPEASIQKFMQGLSQILPGLPPEKAQAIGQLLISVIGQEESGEPLHPPGPPPVMPQPGLI